MNLKSCRSVKYELKNKITSMQNLIPMYYEPIFNRRESCHFELFWCQNRFVLGTCISFSGWQTCLFYLLKNSSGPPKPVYTTSIHVHID